MAAATSHLHQPFGFGPLGPHGGQQQMPSLSTPGPPTAPHPEDQQHKPFFFIQPPQPFVPVQSMQWPVPLPMPVSYSPYCGYPGVGYGIPMMPPYPPNPYMEAPGFVVPHSHLHLMDYRRMLNPHYYQSMAYHARRLRYQHNGPSRETTSSEVQTEPLSASRRTGTPGSAGAVTSGGTGVRSSDATGISTARSLSPALAVQRDQSLELKDAVSSSTNRPPPPPKGSFVIQTEEVRIECCTTPVGLQLLHSHESAEVSHGFSKEVVQCSSMLHGHVVQDDDLSLPVDQSEQAPQVCPDILLVGTPCSGEKTLTLEDSGNQADAAAGASDLDSQVAPVDAEENAQRYQTPKNFDLRVLRLPFDSKYLDERRWLDTALWSSEDDTLVPSPEILMDYSNKIAPMPESDPAVLMREKPALEEIPLPEEEVLDLEPSVEPPGVNIVCDADICPVMDVPEADEAPVTALENTAEPVGCLKDTADANQHRCDSNPDHQDTSFESLPAYLPSSSWLSDFDSIHYCGKIPPPPKKTKSLSSHVADGRSRRRKLDLEYEEPAVRKPKESSRPNGKADRRSFSDHECCVSRSFNENTFLPYGSKEQHLCTRCLAKQRVYGSTSPGLDGQTLKRKGSPFQQRDDLPTCDVCKDHRNRKLARECSSPDVRCARRLHDAEGGSSEFSSCRTALTWGAAEDQRKFAAVKKPLAPKQNLERSPTATYPKLNEKNCVRNELQHQLTTRQRLHHCPHGNAIREMDENCAMAGSVPDKWRNTDHVYPAQRCQSEKSWKATTPRAQYLNKHKKSQPQSRGSYRKDKWC